MQKFWNIFFRDQNVLLAKNSFEEKPNSRTPVKHFTISLPPKQGKCMIKASLDSTRRPERTRISSSYLVSCWKTLKVFPRQVGNFELSKTFRRKVIMGKECEYIASKTVLKHFLVTFWQYRRRRKRYKVVSRSSEIFHALHKF